MDLNFQQHIPADLSDSSRVWIYQGDRPFTVNEIPAIKKMLDEFVAGWKSHGADVKGYANIFFDQFIVFLADETATGVSGCSTDSSVRLIKMIEQKLNVQLFERQQLAFIIKERIQLLPISQLKSAVETGLVNDNTFYFNNTVRDKKELLLHWIIPVKESWLAKRSVNSL